MSAGALCRGMVGFMLAVERVVADWVVSPGPAVRIERVSALFRAGATIVNIHCGQADQRQVIDFYGRQVLSAMRAALAG